MVQKLMDWWHVDWCQIRATWEVVEMIGVPKNRDGLWRHGHGALCNRCRSWSRARKGRTIPILQRQNGGHQKKNVETIIEGIQSKFKKLQTTHILMYINKTNQATNKIMTMMFHTKDTHLKEI